MTVLSSDGSDSIDSSDSSDSSEGSDSCDTGESIDTEKRKEKPFVQIWIFLSLAFFTIEIVISFNKINLTPEQPMRFSQGRVLHFLQCLWLFGGKFLYFSIFL